MLPLHPRTRKLAASFGIDLSAITVIEPVGFGQDRRAQVGLGQGRTLGGRREDDRLHAEKRAARDRVRREHPAHERRASRPAVRGQVRVASGVSQSQTCVVVSGGHWCVWNPGPRRDLEESRKNPD